MAGSSSYSPSVLDSEEYAEGFIEQASERHLRRRNAVDDLRSSRWEWPISSLNTSTDAHSSTSDSLFDDPFAPEYSPEGACPEATTLWVADCEQSRSALTDLLFNADHSLIESPDLQRSFWPGWPSSEASSISDLGEPSPLSAFDDHPFGGYSSEVSPIAIWNSDLVSDGAQTPSPVIPFPEYIDMMSPPYTDNFTIQADASPLATPASDNIRIWESDLYSATPSLASRYSDTPEIHRATSLGGFSFQEEDQSMEDCSFVEDHESSLHNPDCVLSPDSAFSSDSVTSPAISGRSMEGLTFDDRWWVQDPIAEMEEQYAHAIEHANSEGLPVLLPGQPIPTSSQAATPLISFSVPASPAYCQDTPELLRLVSVRLARLVMPDSAVSSPVVQPASSTAAAPPKPQRPKLSLITDFSIPYPVCAYPKRKPTKAKQQQTAQAPASPQPEAIPEALIHFYCPDTAESSRQSGKKRAVFPKETYPRPESQLTKAEQQPVSDLASSQPQAAQKPSTRFDVSDTSEPFRPSSETGAMAPKETSPPLEERRLTDKPSRRTHKVDFAKPSRRQRLVHAAAEHFHYPKIGHPLREWLKSLSAPKEEKQRNDRGQASVVHPLLKQPDQEGLKSRAQTQASTAIAMGKMAVAGLFTAGLFFALQRATGWREVNDDWW